MDYINIPIIVVMCYITNEVCKVLFKKKQKVYKLIPILVSMFGGLLGVLMYLTNKEMINTTNVWTALSIGIISGQSATGTNQMIKQILYKEK